MEQTPTDRWQEILRDAIRSRIDRVRRVAEREHVPLREEALRVLVVSGFILVDGLVVPEVLRVLEDPWRWPAFLAVLAPVVYGQWRLYRWRWPEDWDEPPGA